MSSVISIPARRNGPLDSGQGGYAAGRLAGFIAGAAEISLRAPVPLDKELDVVHDEGLVRLIDGKTLVADGRAVPTFDLDVPEPVSGGEARDAATRYRGLTDGQFSHCFVCGRARHDSYGVFAGAVEGRELVATPWTPRAETAGEDGLVRQEFIWAVLDCPTYFALYAGEATLPVSFLARQTTRIDGPVQAGEEHVIMAWPLGRDGRKHTAGIALITASGQTLAIAEALLIQAR